MYTSNSISLARCRRLTAHSCLVTKSVSCHRPPFALQVSSAPVPNQARFCCSCASCHRPPFALQVSSATWSVAYVFLSCYLYICLLANRRFLITYLTAKHASRHVMSTCFCIRSLIAMAYMFFCWCIQCDGSIYICVHRCTLTNQDSFETIDRWCNAVSWESLCLKYNWTPFLNLRI
jgi:lipid-A-disaccharide synthase-like uncharacterized protein